MCISCGLMARHFQLYPIWMAVKQEIWKSWVLLSLILAFFISNNLYFGKRMAEILIHQLKKLEEKISWRLGIIKVIFTLAKYFLRGHDRGIVCNPCSKAIQTWYNNVTNNWTILLVNPFMSRRNPSWSHSKTSLQGRMWKIFTKECSSFYFQDNTFVIIFQGICLCVVAVCFHVRSEGCSRTERAKE